MVTLPAIPIKGTDTNLNKDLNSNSFNEFPVTNWFLNLSSKIPSLPNNSVNTPVDWRD